MRRETIYFGEKLAQAVVDFGCFERAETKPNARDVSNESLDEHGQCGVRVHAVVTDVYSGQHDLGMVIRETLRLAHECHDASRPRCPTCERGRAERTVLVASVLDAQECARSRLNVRWQSRRGQPDGLGNA